MELHKKLATQELAKREIDRRIKLKKLSDNGVGDVMVALSNRSGDLEKAVSEIVNASDKKSTALTKALETLGKNTEKAIERTSQVAEASVKSNAENTAKQDQSKNDTIKELAYMMQSNQAEIIKGQGEIVKAISESNKALLDRLEKMAKAEQEMMIERTNSGFIKSVKIKPIEV